MFFLSLMMESNHVELWNRCLQVIRDNVSEHAFNTWFKPIIPLKYENKTLHTSDV